MFTVIFVIICIFTLFSSFKGVSPSVHAVFIVIKIIDFRYRLQPLWLGKPPQTIKWMFRIYDVCNGLKFENKLILLLITHASQLYVNM